MEFTGIYFVYNIDLEFYCRWCNSGLYDRAKVKEVGGKWYGPITSPE